MTSAPSETTPADIALLHPPTCDPTAPYLAVPMLTGFLRAHGVAVLSVHAKVEAFDALLAPGALGALRDRLESRLTDRTRRRGRKCLDIEPAGAGLSRDEAIDACHDAVGGHARVAG